jgi:pimeloyl-ACP methyl ester carboxylesterase
VVPTTVSHGPSAVPLPTRISWWVAVCVVAFITVGAFLSRLIEPGVQVKTITLAGDIPALQFVPSGTAPHPVAVLAHGVTASKETLFRFGEALAAAGFVCYAFDFPGHGQSPQAFRAAVTMRAPDRVAQAVGPVDVFLGHSMGAWVGAAAVREGGLSPRLFIAVGSAPNFGGHGPRLLLLAGAVEEAVPPGWLKAQTDARLVISPWSDHALEPYDALLVNAAVEAACATVGRTPPSAPRRWVWRLAGLWIGMASAFWLALWLPALPARWRWARGPLVAAIVLAAAACLTTTWFGGTPVLRRIPQQIVLAGIALIVMLGAAKVRIPRWSFAALPAAVAIGCAIAGLHLLAMFVGCGVLVLGWGVLVGAIAAHRGSRRDGDIAMAIFVGYAMGQWMPMFY